MISKTPTAPNVQPLGGAFVAAVLVCVILNPLNSSTISVALPILLHALHTTSSGITWIVSGYYLGSAIAQPVMGKLGDIWGRSRFVYIGLLLMIVTAVLAPLSQSLIPFVLWRVVQAIGTSMIYPNAIGMLREYRAGDVGKILGWIGMVSGVALAVGPTIGGFLVDYTSWHSIFWLNIPFSLIAIGLLWWKLPRDSEIKKIPTHGPRFKLDWAGMVLFAAAVTTWLLWSNTTHPFMAPQSLLMLVSGIMTVLLIVAELRTYAPILPVRWFRRPQFALSSVITVLANLVMYCILYGLPVYLETVRKFTATRSGLLLLAFAGVLSLASPLGGRFAQGKKRRMPIVTAGTFLVAGTLVLCWANVLPAFGLVIGLACVGVSFSISNVVIQQIVLNSVPKQETGQASGVYTLLRYVGTMASSVFIGSSVGSVVGARHLFISLTVISVITTCLAVGLRDED